MSRNRTSHLESLGSSGITASDSRIVPSLDTSFSPRGSLRTPKLLRASTNLNGELNLAIRQEFHSKIAMIGYGVYGEAIHHRLAEKFDILPWARQSAAHRSSDRVTTDLSKALDGRGILMFAVPSNAFPNVLSQIRPHKEGVIISFAKGLIVPGWDPVASEQSLREGPPVGARALTPLEYIREHPNWSHVKDNLVFVGGPGSPKTLRTGDTLDSPLAVCRAMTQRLQTHSGRHSSCSAV